MPSKDQYVFEGIIRYNYIRIVSKSKRRDIEKNCPATHRLIFEIVPRRQGPTRLPWHHFYLLKACGDHNPVAEPKALKLQGFAGLKNKNMFRREGILSRLFLFIRILMGYT